MDIFAGRSAFNIIVISLSLSTAGFLTHWTALSFLSPCNYGEERVIDETYHLCWDGFSDTSAEIGQKGNDDLSMLYTDSSYIKPNQTHLEFLV